MAREEGCDFWGFDQKHFVCSHLPPTQAKLKTSLSQNILLHEFVATATIVLVRYFMTTTPVISLLQASGFHGGVSAISLAYLKSFYCLASLRASLLVLLRRSLGMLGCQVEKIVRYGFSNGKLAFAKLSLWREKVRAVRCINMSS